MDRLDELMNRIIALASSAERPILVSIEGRCASGKTTLAADLEQELKGKGVSCGVLHMDDFFLRMEQRTQERYDTPGANVDYERFWEEVFQKLLEGAQSISYRPFICKTKSLGEPVSFPVGQVVIVEGCYSQRPEFRDHYDLKIFKDIDSETQMARIINRNGADWARVFRERWIPLEEAYFANFNIAEQADMRL